MQEVFKVENGVLLSFSGEQHSVIVPEGVKVIGKEVFKGMAWITDIFLPDGLKEIGDNAFKGCKKLERINIPDSVEKIGELAFHRCHSLGSVVLPDSVKTLEKGTFLFCDSLKSIQAFGVKKLEMQTFANDTQLTDISLNSEIDCSNFKKDVFTGCISIKNIHLSNGYFYHADDLVSLLMDNKTVDPVVRSIAESIYQSLEIENGVLYKLHVNLKSFELPEGIKCIEKSCFFDKKGIVSISFPESLERIMSNAFGNCINLEQIKLKNEDIIIDEDAFRGCSNLKKIIIGSQVYDLGSISYADDTPYIIRRISDQVMSDFYISGKVLMSYTGNEERITIPDGIEVIGESCFEGNDKVNRVILSDTVREIHENAFRNCVCMQTIVMSEGLHSICRNAFENCLKLIRFNIPVALEKVEVSAFRGCQSLELSGFEKGTPLAGTIKEREYGANDIAAYSHGDDEKITQLVLEKPSIIGKYAFSACPSLESVVINGPGCIVEKYAFEKCCSLRSIKVTASKIEKGAFSFCRNLGKVEISGVSVLEDEVFAGCSSLREVKLSDEVSEIGRRCFDECTSLDSFDLEKIRIIGERAFERCDSLKEITLNNTDVGYHAFADCSNLRKMILDSGTKLQSGAFMGCTCADTVVLDGQSYSFSCFSQSRNTADNKLPIKVQEIIGSIYSCFEINRSHGIVKYRGDAAKVRIPDDIISAEDEAFRDHLRVVDIIFPDGFSYSGKLAFSGTGWLEKRRKEVRYNIVNDILIDAACCGETAEIPENIRRICSWAFAGNTHLKELIMKNDRIAVDAFAFRNCINLKTIHYSDGRKYTLEKFSDVTEKEYPELVRRIFSECINCFKLNDRGVLEESTGNIKELVFPEGIKEIADQVYMDCNLLETIVFSDDTEKIGKSSFKNSKWLRSVKNAGSVVRIDAHAFSGCRSLETIDISDKLEFLGKRAFEHCCELKEIHISDKLTVIPEKAFFRCKSLKKVVIPDSVKEIGPQAFAFCTELEEVFFVDPDNVKIADDAFAWCDKL